MADLKWNRAFAMEQAGDDEELLQELLQIFKDASASDCDKLKVAIGQEESGQAGAAAHSIKGAAASLGMEGIRELALLIETDCRNGSLAVAKERVAELEDLLGQLRQV